ncbi:transporter [Magnetovirga frankeli]|uniref:transporter n=1 Tax=Magnetovirga frankeli TaxID=947516 RepID=UPI001293A8BE|nr:transporter [gamma proteobacterium SS-5]
MHRWAIPLFALVGSLFAGSAASATNDIYPGDYYPSEPGDRIVSFYAYDRTSAGPYAKGSKQANGKLTGQIAALRGVNTFELAGMTATSVVALTWADLSAKPVTLANAIGRNTTGFGDLRLGLTVWPIKDRRNANYLGLSAMVIAPTGSFNSGQLLNYAENRWRLVLSGGWQKDITPKVLFELLPELTLYGDNDDYLGNNTLEQDPALALTGYLRWRVTPAFHLHLGGQLNWGGAATLNGVALDNPPENSRVNLGATWFLPGKQQLILRLAKEIDNENGFRTDREIALRYQKAF